MSVMSINPKFDIGDVVYIIRKQKYIRACHICNGKCKIEYNEKLMTCPECQGMGTINTNKEISVAKEMPFVIKSIRASIPSNVFRYKVASGIESYDRAEENLYVTLQEAQERCEYLNKERKYINLSDIIIKDCFNETIPDPQKIARRISEYKSNKKFDSEIILNSDGVLIDGYTAYLVCKMFEIPVIKVVIE